MWDASIKESSVGIQKGLLWKVLFSSDALVTVRCLTPDRRNMNSLVLPKATWKITKMEEVGFVSRLQKSEPLYCPELRLHRATLHYGHPPLLVRGWGKGGQ